MIYPIHPQCACEKIDEKHNWKSCQCVDFRWNLKNSIDTPLSSYPHAWMLGSRMRCIARKCKSCGKKKWSDSCILPRSNNKWCRLYRSISNNMPPWTRMKLLKLQTVLLCIFSPNYFWETLPDLYTNFGTDTLCQKNIIPWLMTIHHVAYVSAAKPICKEV